MTPKPANADAGPKTGRFAEKLAAHSRDYWAYVPDDHSTANRYGLVVWIHPPGDTMEKEQLDRWQAPCQERGLIVLGPKAGEPTRWTPEDVPFIIELTKKFVAEYSVDPARVVIHTFGRGVQPALEAAVRERALFKGICLAGAVGRGVASPNRSRTPVSSSCCCAAKRTPRWNPCGRCAKRWESCVSRRHC